MKRKMSKKQFILDVVIENSTVDELLNLAMAFLEETVDDEEQFDEWAMLFIAQELLQYTDAGDVTLQISEETDITEEDYVTFEDFVGMYAADVLLENYRPMSMLGKIMASLPQIVQHANNITFVNNMFEAAGFEFKEGQEEEDRGTSISHLRVVPNNEDKNNV